MVKAALNKGAFCGQRIAQERGKDGVFTGKMRIQRGFTNADGVCNVTERCTLIAMGKKNIKCGINDSLLGR